MIWSDSIFSTGPGLEVLAKHIATEIQSAGRDFPDDTAPYEEKELARSVAEFVSRHTRVFRQCPASHGEQSADADNSVLIPSDYLLLMICRALWAVGKEQAARTLLRTRGPELDISESYADAVFADDLFSCLGIYSALIRALRPSSSVWSLNGPYWVLDLRTVFSFLDAGLELTIWRILHALIKQLAALWDISGGKGTLGLRNARFIAFSILGFPYHSRRDKQFSAELFRYCEQDLKMISGERRWRFIPAVINLDA
jgi:hypothetical protein